MEPPYSYLSWGTLQPDNLPWLLHCLFFSQIIVQIFQLPTAICSLILNREAQASCKGKGKAAAGALHHLRCIQGWSLGHTPGPQNLTFGVSIIPFGRFNFYAEDLETEAGRWMLNPGLCDTQAVQPF